MKLNYKRTFFIGLAFMSISSFWVLYDNIIPLMLMNTFHINETLIGVLMGMDNVLAIIMLPLFGALSDKINTPLGKRTPFIIIGTVLATIFMILVPIADYQGNLIFFLVALGLLLIAMGSYRSPAVALMPDLTPKPLRSKANAVINLMGAIGGVYALGIIKLLIKDRRPNYLPIFLSVNIVMILAVILLLITIKEKKLAMIVSKQNETDKELMNEINEVPGQAMPKEVKKSFIFILASIFLWFTAYNAVSSAYSRYAEAVWNLKPGGFADAMLVAMIVAIISYIPIGIISSKIGRKKTILGGIVLLTTSFLLGFLFVEYSGYINIVFAFTGIGWAAINVNSLPMVVELCKGSDIGKYTGLYYTFSMLAQTLTPIASGALLQYISYRTLFPYAVLFSSASFCTMMFVKHGDSKPIRKKDVLENFDMED